MTLSIMKFHVACSRSDVGPNYLCPQFGTPLLYVWVQLLVDVNFIHVTRRMDTTWFSCGAWSGWKMWAHSWRQMMEGWIP